MIAWIKKIPRALVRRFGLMVDYARYATRLRPWRLMLKNIPAEDCGTLLIISGRGMNISWGQIWALLTLPLRIQGYCVVAITMRSSWFSNRYLQLMGIELQYLEDLGVAAEIPAELLKTVAEADTLDKFSAIRYQDAPVGQIALSTYSRHRGTGLIDCASPEVRLYMAEWIGRVCSTMLLAEQLFAKHNVTMLFFTEVFMEEYGAFYYAALNANLNILRFAGTVRDNGFIMQHLAKEHDRIHHSSIDPATWAQIKARTDDAAMEAELAQNFRDRYGAKWHRSVRNHPGTQIMDVAEARRKLGLAEGRKVAVIYSHILYDTLFFFGTDLFRDYSEWLVETTRAAMSNPHIDWLIKVHPSNLWRGEMDSLLKGKYEEERLLRRTLGKLPSHVRIVGADTRINPYTWFRLADYGITVRGTSGLEMAALGKTVITAGTGRYENNGFTLDPVNAGEYLEMLRRIHELPAPTPEQVRLAKRYAHAIFCLKPYTLTCVTPHKRFGCKKVHASDDLIYLPSPLAGVDLPSDLARFGAWAVNRSERDLLADAR